MDHHSHGNLIPTEAMNQQVSTWAALEGGSKTQNIVRRAHPNHSARYTGTGTLILKTIALRRTWV
jgi:hypothetical protein